MNIPRILLVVVAALLALGLVALGILGDWYWFSTVGYEEVYRSILLTRIGLFAAGFLVFFAFAFLNVQHASRHAAGLRGEVPEPFSAEMFFAAVAAVFAGLSVAGSWETVLKYLNQTPFGLLDPIFGMDVGFYVFSLPFIGLILNFLVILFVVTIILCAIPYLAGGIGVHISGGPRPTVVMEEGAGTSLRNTMKGYVPQLSALLFLTFLTLAARIWLARFNVLFSTGGAVIGAGYTDVHVTIPVLTILSVVALVIGVGFLVNEKFKKIRVITYGIAAFFIIAFIGIAAGAVVQGLIVQPDELTLEEEYLEHNIQFTLAAYGLDTAEEKIFPVSYNLTRDDLMENSATIDNIRLWDWRALKTTYEQLQLFRTYYNFKDVDVDRYHFDGNYQQVLISAREMNIDGLPQQAQTWVNRHLVYTHGFGAVINPADEVTAEGLPVFYMKDIPPVSPYLALDQARIYYGEDTGNYVVTMTTTDEFDYSAGDLNVYQNYEGQGGVALDGTLKRLIYALKFGSVELLVSGSVTDESRVLFYRSVGDRARTIAPFLSYDQDPYLVVADGRLFWIIDAYTTAERFPYSEPVRVPSLEGTRLNYIRNSVKVVVDAYNGDISYYVIEPEDPLIRTYGEMFPGLLKDYDEMPASLRSHVRYPEGLFDVQAYLYATYHMKDPRVFYNREDAWVIPDEIYRGSRQQMESYYVIMKLPGEEGEEFILMIPFTPRNKENMIGWMAARSDGDAYGTLIVYQFSKQELTYGPMQIEARIDQDTEISRDITLWSQAGSSVLRGNTLVIPVEDSIIYVEPLYLEATERGTLPQLQRVIVAYNDRLTMQETLTEALEVLFGGGAGDGDGVPPIDESDREKIMRIADLYDRANRALAEGDLGAYQEYVDEIGRVVES